MAVCSTKDSTTAAVLRKEEEKEGAQMEGKRRRDGKENGNW